MAISKDGLNPKNYPNKSTVIVDDDLDTLFEGENREEQNTTEGYSSDDIDDYFEDEDDDLEYESDELEYEDNDIEDDDDWLEYENDYETENNVGSIADLFEGSKFTIDEGDDFIEEKEEYDENEKNEILQKLMDTPLSEGKEAVASHMQEELTNLFESSELNTEADDIADKLSEMEYEEEESMCLEDWNDDCCSYCSCVKKNKTAKKILTFATVVTAIGAVIYFVLRGRKNE